MPTVYYLQGPKAELDKLTDMLSHRKASKAIAILEDDQGGIPASLVRASEPGRTPRLDWLESPLTLLQREHEAGNPVTRVAWGERERRAAWKAWLKCRADIAMYEGALLSLRRALSERASQVIRTHGVRPLAQDGVEVYPQYSPYNDHVSLLEKPSGKRS